MNELCVVTPSYRRAWDSKEIRLPVPAGEVFTGNFSRKCQQYASLFYPDSWCIIDAAAGFLFPHQLVRGRHDKCLYRKETIPISEEELRWQAVRIRLDRYDRISVLGGRRFIELVEDAFPGRRIRAPLAGRGGIGEMMREMNIAMHSGEKL